MSWPTAFTTLPVRRRPERSIPLRVVNPVRGASLCYVLREDAELADVISRPHREEAIAHCTAREVRIPAGDDVSESFPLTSGLGMLVLNGLLIGRVGIDGRFGAEILGEGDLLRPWQWETDSATLPLEMAWSIVEPVRLALLDDDFVDRMIGRFPELAAAVVGRAMQRARNLAVNMAIVHQARVDSRLHMLLWHLAGRWGRVRTEGTVVPFRLTHRTLADLVAARRPTVTSALSDLSRRGLVQSRGGEWILFGGPPRELLDIDGVGVPIARDTLPPLASSS
ncbi:MAG: Crp/Fnr family transcriptional regulator [Candidatus Woesearchaeota archaeon]